MKDWKTTLAGLGLGILQVVAGVHYQGGMTLRQWAVAAGFAVLGYLASDSKKTV
jgi:hypothetical protein